MIHKIIFSIILTSLQLLSQNSVDDLKIIEWSKPGQRDTISGCNRTIIIYKNNIDPYSTQAKFVRMTNFKNIILELKDLDTLLPFKAFQARSIAVPKEGGTPDISEIQIEKDVRTITFREFNQKEKVLNGEEVNIQYEDLDVSKIYLSYQSVEDGYVIELNNIYEDKTIIFDMLCQKYIVANPSKIKIQVNQSLIYEQIIWTPRTDSQWEVRIGTTERGCKSEALEDIIKKRNPMYEQNIRKLMK